MKSNGFSTIVRAPLEGQQRDGVIDFMHLINGGIPQRTDIEELSRFGRAENVIARMGISLIRPPAAKMPSGAGGLISQPFDKASRSFVNREIKLSRKIRASSALGQWCLWHETGHGVDFLRDARLNCKFMCSDGVKGRGKLSRKFRKLLHSHSGFIKGLNPVPAFVTDDQNHVFEAIPTIESAIVDRVEEHILIERLKSRRAQVSGYKSNPKELFAEAFACYAMHPRLLRQHAFPVYRMMKLLFAKFGIVRPS